MRLAAVLLGSILLAGSSRDAAASKMLAPAPWVAKEFTIIHHQGTYHLFYMRRDLSKPIGEWFKDLGHATSPDLVTWTQRAPVLPVRPGSWDDGHIWAPHLLRRGSTFYMFYTAVTHIPGPYDQHQRIGLATSTDLVNWTRFDQPVLACGDASWTYCDSTFAGGDFRDPFVMPDPANPGGYLMYFVARSGADHDQFIAGVAHSNGNLMQWTNAVALDNTHRSRTGSYVTESPDLLLHGGYWYLFYTTWNVTPICFQLSADPQGAPTDWSVQRSLDAEVPASNTNPWFGPEHVSVNGRDYFAAVNSEDFSIEFREIAWTGGTRFTFAEPTAVEPLPTEWRLGLAGDVPGRGSLSISIQAPRDADVRLRVFDATGRLRRRLKMGTVAGGTTTIDWNGIDDFGRSLGSGLYFLVLDTPDARLTRRLVRLQ